jgi:hypothetical protein
MQIVTWTPQVLQLRNVWQILSSLVMYEKQEMSYLDKYGYSSVELHYIKHDSCIPYYILSIKK